MRARAELALTLLVVGGLPLTGCGHELVRVSIDPAPTSVEAPRDVIRATVACGGMTADDGARLASALTDVGAFEGPVRCGDDTGDAQIEATLEVVEVSAPVIGTGPRAVLCVLGTVVPVFAPLMFVWTEREPDLVEELKLTVAVRGEASAGRYTCTARGTVAAQTPNHWFQSTADIEAVEVEVVAAHRATLRAAAIEALVARFAADEDARRRLREQLDDGPPAELEPLLVTKETHAPRAQWRTRRLLAWKAACLDAFLAESKVPALREHVGRLEACMVELAHGAELAKDDAEERLAAGAAPRGSGSPADGSARDARALSLALRERLEILRPILASIKEELDARSR